jgi:hypothetical protein
MKQAERTPGRFWVENRDGRWQVQMEHRGPGSSFCVAQINHWADDGRALAEQIVNSLNAYTSTEALRSALEAYEKWEADLIGSNEAWYTREREPLELPRFTQALWDRLLEIQAMRNAALSGSPAPSAEPQIVTSHALPVTMWDRIATAVVKRVAELPDRSSPDDWPDAMLVTSEELHRIIMSEFDAEIG